MDEREERAIYCPYCGECIEVLIDPSETEQSYIEDCQVCCRPIELELSRDQDGELDLRVRHENE